MRGFGRLRVTGVAIATLTTAVVAGLVVTLTGAAGNAATAGNPGAVAAGAAVMDGETGVPIEVRVDGAATSPTPSPTGGGGGPLPRTGGDIMTLAGVGLVLVAAGVAAVLFGRRRRAAAGRGAVPE